MLAHAAQWSERLAIQPLAPPKTRVPRSQVLFDGRPTRVRVDGIVLEAILPTDQGALILTTDDCPFEERLHITLLSRELRALDRIGLGAPYTAATLKDLERLAPNQFRFRFFGSDEWRLSTTPPRWRLPLLSATLGHRSGPVVRPLSRLFSRPRIRLEGSYQAAADPHQNIRS